MAGQVWAYRQVCREISGALAVSSALAAASNAERCLQVVSCSGAVVRRYRGECGLCSLPAGSATVDRGWTKSCCVRVK